LDVNVKFDLIENLLQKHEYLILTERFKEGSNIHKIKNLYVITNMDLLNLCEDKMKEFI